MLAAMHQPLARPIGMLESDQVSLADIRLRAPTSWAFFDFAGLVLAQRDFSGGSLQISTAFRFECEGERDPEVSEKLTREFAGDAQVGPFTTETIDPKGDIVGWGDVGKVGSDGRVWYVLRDGQLMLGIYRRNSPGASDDILTLELQEADAILRSAQWRTERSG